MKLPAIELLKKCPKKAKLNISRTATCLHCLYWGDQALGNALSAFTPLYIGLFVMTILAHIVHLEIVGETK